MQVQALHCRTTHEQQGHARVHAACACFLSPVARPQVHSEFGLGCPFTLLVLLVPPVVLVSRVVYASSTSLMCWSVISSSSLRTGSLVGAPASGSAVCQAECPQACRASAWTALGCVLPADTAMHALQLPTGDE